MKRLVIGLVSVVALAFVAPAAADRPSPFTFEDVFPDVNPCTGNTMIVTIAETGLVHEHATRVVGRAHRTITTSDGSVGHGTSSFVDQGKIVKFRFTDIMTNDDAGYRFRARGVFVLHIPTDTVRVDRFELICLGR
jgi:hypothetical protein